MASVLSGSRLKLNRSSAPCNQLKNENHQRNNQKDVN